MSGDSSRREFLVAASLAGAALATGGAAGCGNDKTGMRQQVDIDEDGRLIVRDPELADKLTAIWNYQESVGDTLVNGGIPVVFGRIEKPKTVWPDPARISGGSSQDQVSVAAGTTRSPRVQNVSWTEDSPEGSKVNSLCRCMPGE